MAVGRRFRHNHHHNHSKYDENHAEMDARPAGCRFAGVVASPTCERANIAAAG
jgi:hypothetical protein